MPAQRAAAASYAGSVLRVLSGAVADSPRRDHRGPERHGYFVADARGLESRLRPAVDLGEQCSTRRGRVRDLGQDVADRKTERLEEPAELDRADGRLHERREFVRQEGPDVRRIDAAVQRVERVAYCGVRRDQVVDDNAAAGLANMRRRLLTRVRSPTCDIEHDHVGLEGLEPRLGGKGAMTQTASAPP